MKYKWILVLCVLCVFAISALTLAVSPSPYERLTSEVVPLENIAEIAEREYAEVVSHVLIKNKTEYSVSHLSDEEIRSAKLLGPFPIFNEMADPERFYFENAYPHEGLVPFNSVDELVGCLRHTSNAWAVVVMTQDDDPICFFQISDDLGHITQSTHVIWGAFNANAFYVAYQKLARDSASEKLILSPGDEMFFTDDSNRLSLVASPNVDYPLVTNNEFLHATNTMMTESSLTLNQSVGNDFTKYLFGEDVPPVVRRPNLFMSGLVLGASAVLLGIASFAELKKRKRGASLCP